MKVKHLQHALDAEGPMSGPGFQPHTLLLLGAGAAHMHVLSQLAREPLVGVQVVLVAQHPRPLHASMLPGLVAGHYGMEDCSIPLAELVRRAGVRWLQSSVTAFSAEARMVRLDSGLELPFDWASINTCPVQDRDAIEAALAGARTHALFLWPLEGFAALWPRVASMGDERALRVAVMGDGDTGAELAMALHHRLPHCAITLVCGDHVPGSTGGEAMQRRIGRALKARNITVLRDSASGFHDGEVLLSSGARLACDVPLISDGAQTPRWLQESALALSPDGRVQVNAFQQSTSHPNVFAVGEVAAFPAAAHNDIHALRSGPALMRNLAATTRNDTLHAHPPKTSALNLVSCGNQTAIASWGRWSAQGRWVWWWKNHCDRRFMARYTATASSEPARA